MQIADSGRSRSPSRFPTRGYSPPTIDYSALLGCHLDSRRPKDVSARDGRCTDRGKTAVCLRTPDKHIGHVGQVLTILNDAGETPSLKKCKFFTTCIDYLCHAFCAGSLNVSTRTIDADRRLEQSANLTESLSLLYLCNIFRRFFQI